MALTLKDAWDICNLYWHKTGSMCGSLSTAVDQDRHNKNLISSNTLKRKDSALSSQVLIWLARRHRKQTCGYQRGKGRGMDRLRAWN